MQVRIAFPFSLCSTARMPADSSPAAATPHVPTFTPVPVRARRDGWTEERQRLFIRALVATRSVGQAAQAAGMSRESAYRLRRREGAGSFAAAWDSILAARPRGTSSYELVWHRLVRGAGGRAAIRRVDVPADWEARHSLAPGPADGRPARGRSQ